MRKGIFLLAVGLVFAAASIGLADTGGSAKAKLKLNAVINIDVTDNWDNLTIRQSDIGSWGAGTVIDWDSGTDDIVVLLKAITNFNLWACYYAKEGTNDVDPPLGNANDLLIITDSDDSTDYVLLYKEITDPNAYSGPYNSSTLTLLASGSNNIADGGLIKTYNVKLKPENLGDRAAGENITFTIVFVVEDPTGI